MFPAGFNQKTTKEDLIIKGKYEVPPWYLRGKTLEGLRSHITKAEGHPLTGGAARPLGGAIGPLWTPPVSLVAMSVSHRLLGCITFDALGYIISPCPLKVSSHLRIQKP